MAPKETVMTVDEFIELAESRAQTYIFLASLYYYDSLPMIAKLIKKKKLLEAVPSSGEGFKILKFFVEEEAPKSNDLLEDLQIEHTGLFVMAKTTKGRPYESFYLDKDRKIGARVTIDVDKLYNSMGISFTDAKDEIADYIAIELEFMHHMCSREAEAWREGDWESARALLNIEKEFITEHLGKWVKQFGEDVLEDAKLGFFKAAVHFLTEFMEIEKHDIVNLSSAAEKVRV